MKHIYVILLVFLVFGCKQETKTEKLSAQDIVNKSIETSGGKTFENSVIRFDFRDKYYVARRNKGNFSLIRIFSNDKDSVFDLLTNNSFERFVNGNRTILEDSIANNYYASVNSVHYFSVLPYGLNDQAVNKTLVGEEQIKNKDYYKVQVTFNEEGGGEDFEDVFIYWIDKETFKLDYLAYSYNEDDGKGMRFRVAYNERYVDGLRFVDYYNYKPEDDNLKLRDMGKAFDNNQLKLLSKIELRNVEVELIDFQ
ncbi:DUF6503 family protein [Winogradskyella sp.]|uniref:DUF6503 family protein n=1 Tax=Winogradskyella sp. TaxID=1883156 RepID=UPI00261FAE16|nr:DUF6503 family protein [Winogradskyella sp.]